jgi:SAM-dependent methyltransferase
MTHWHQDDAFWDQMGPLLFTKAQWESAPDEVERAVKLLELPDSAAVLDIPCGPGRHALELARRGFRVTGVDRTRAYLDEARRLASDESLSVEWVEADMREFRREAAYDAVLNLYTSFGYFGDPAEEIQTAGHFWASLRPGGRLLMDMMGKEVVARIYQERDWQELDDGVLFLQERRPIRDWRGFDIRWIAIRGAQRHEQRFTLQLYSAAELVALLRDVGFDLVTVYGSLDGVAYDHRAARLIVMAQKR